MACEFWVIFGFLGLMFVPCILLFASSGETAKGKIASALICICFWFLFAGGIYFQEMGNAERWNDSYCECGQHWELNGVTKTRSGSETKYYSCPEYFKEIEINH